MTIEVTKNMCLRKRFPSTPQTMGAPTISEPIRPTTEDRPTMVVPTILQPSDPSTLQKKADPTMPDDVVVSQV